MSNSPQTNPHTALVAVVEDDAALRDELSFQLRHHGFQVVAFADAYGLYRHMATNKVAAVVLDIGLPGEDGLSIARLLRGHDAQLGIVFLTARAQREDRLTGLQTGADAYLTKPVDLDELVLLLRRLLARLQGLRQDGATAATAPGGDARPEGTETAIWKLHTDRALLLSPEGHVIRLTVVEMQLLATLAQRQGRPVKPVALARGMGVAADEWNQHRMEVIVSRLRNKVERDTGLKAPIRTLRGEGYAWTAEEPRPAS